MTLKKALGLLAVLWMCCYAPQSVQAQVSNDWENGDRGVYSQDCWTFSGFTVSGNNAITGSLSARSQTYSSSSCGIVREFASPYLEFSGTHTISFVHRKIQSGDIRVYIVLIDKNGNEKEVFSTSGYAVDTDYNESFDVTETGIYRVAFRSVSNSGGNTDNRTVFDNINITGVADLGDRNQRDFIGAYDAIFQACPCIQEAPVAVDDVVDLDEDTSLQFNPSENDTDADGDLDVSSIVILSEPVNGTATLDQASGVITYTPDPNYYGQDEITYQISDQYPYGPVNTATAVITIWVNPVNDPPTSADNTVYTDEDVTYNFKANDILFNDIDGHCFNGFIIVTPLDPDLGDLFYDGAPVELNTLYSDPALLSFVPNPGESGITEFDFRVWDDLGGESGNYTMTIVINDVNDLPLSEDIEVTMEMNTVYYFSADQLVYSDADGDPFGGFIITRRPSSGTLYYDGLPAEENTVYADFSLISFEPDADESGSPYTSFLFRVTDDKGGESIDYTATINVTSSDPGGPLIVSEGFSPNADGINDYWHIEGIDLYANNVVEIYNRWGNLVRKIDAYRNESNAWRGESDTSAWGETVTIGSYFYIIHLGDGSSPLQGFVVLNK
ncbi:MAG: Ig-like domain-containing protein [Cyclobacteriaceae bacterium]